MTTTDLLRACRLVGKPIFFAVMIMVYRGASANLLSVGAIDFGIIVDSSVILVENIHRRLSTSGTRFGILLEEKQYFPDAPATVRGKLSRIFAAALEVDKAIFFTATIIIAAFATPPNPSTHPSILFMLPSSFPDG